MLIRKYSRIWWRLAVNNARAQMATSLASVGYLIGKFLRFGFFLAYILAIFDRLPALEGYTMPHVVLVFMTFNLVDVGAQFLFRGLYGVKALIDEGDLDKYLTQPAHVLFRISSMGIDFLDLLTLVPIVGMTAWALSLIGPLRFFNVFIYILLLINALLIAYAFHVFMGGLSVKTQEFESAIWVYRDVMTLGRFPITIYSDLMRGVLVTLVPIGVMITFPVQALLGLLSWRGWFYSVALALLFHFAAQWFWRRSLRNYTSISS